MKYNSITFKLLSLIIGAFIISAIGVLLTAKWQLSRIIDHSQSAVYAEKIATITDSLERSNTRLQKTGLVDAYRDDFQQTALRDLRQSYYRRPGHAIVLFILAGDGGVVMQPQLPAGDQRLSRANLAEKIPAAVAGEFNYTAQGRQYWCVFQRFPAWQWIIGYTVPLKVKYADVRQFIGLLAAIMGGIGLVTLLGLLLILHRAIIRPIIHLTKGASAIAAGDLERPIESGGNDEINDLSRSFSVMRDSIRRTIVELRNENSQRRQAQQDLAEEKERLIVTLRSIGDGVITADTSGRVVLLNKVAEQLTGWTLEEAAGQPLEEVFNIINDQTGERCETPFAKVIASGQVVGLANHTSLIARDGRRSSLADSGAPIFDADSNIIGVVIVFRDVTEQIITAKELLKVKKLESIGVLAGGIAHDFNNIIMAIMGNINLALFDDSLSDRTKGLLSEAEKAMMRAKDLTQQLLTFSRGGAPIKAAASLEAVIMDSANFVLHGDKVACRYAIADDLWLADIDKGQISQVIQNIVINAAHAMPKGGIINIGCENVPAGSADIPLGARDGDFVKVVIADSGVGIPVDVLERIFDPYFTTKQKGSGLGLAISQSIIGKHGGHILAESRAGIGSSFSIYLPASEKLAAAARSLPDVAAAVAAPAKARILIMDDDELVRNVAGAMLCQLGHEVELVADGEEAVRVYGQAQESGGKFDLVLMDLTIPGGMGGKEAVRGILDLDPAARVIVSSGYSNDPVLASFAEYGFCAAIVKPYRLQEMAVVIGPILAS
ncbi:MAG: response regulator [Deltaproteobacteria bacterium]|nr:response regulator [Deltaproteobacteria bacterium]